MFYLLISILFSAGMVLLFKAFEVFKIENLHALLVNYITASILCNTFSSNEPILFTHFWQHDWFPLTLFLGILFISIFYASAITAQKIAVSVSIVSSKMSVMIPVLFAYYYMDGKLNYITIIGIVGSLLAVYFTVKREEKSRLSGMGNILFPLAVFLGSGIVDSSLNYLQHTYMDTSDVNDQLGLIFGIAGVTGLVVYIVQIITKKQKSFYTKSIIGGIALGSFNYISTICLMKALNEKFIEKTVLFPVANVAIVALTTILSVILFKEKLSKQNWVGIILCLVFILLISQSDAIYRYL